MENSTKIFNVESITWGTDSNSMHLKWIQPLLKRTQMRTIVNDTKGNFLLKLFSAIVHFSIELHFLENMPFTRYAGRFADVIYKITSIL